MAYIFLSANDEHKARAIDADEKNKFKFGWLQQTVKVVISGKELEIKLGECIKKIEISGKVMCTLCTDTVYYGKRGFTAISDHVKSKKHASKELLKRKNYSLPASFFCGNRPITSTNVPTSSAPSPQAPAQVNVPLCDRIANMQALVLGVIAENNLPFTMAPVLVEMSKCLASDKKALTNLSMARTTASYKMKFGLGETFLKATISAMRDFKFSLNIDEATSKNSMRVLSILVSYYSPQLSKVVVEHLASLSVVKVSADALFAEIDSIFLKWGIPWDNLISVLMDSCSVMRGSKNGLEERIRKNRAPHLLDVDGDSCHHIHNACKRFCSPFEKWLEGYLSDVYNDFKWSRDLQENLAEICVVLGIKYTGVDKIAFHRWLSCYDVSLHNLRLLEALTVFYYGFLPEREKNMYFYLISAIYLKKDVTPSGRATIKSIWRQLSAKKLTADGKNRKERIVKKLFYNRENTLLIIHFYIAVLPLLKNYVCLFQMREPLIHVLHEKQKQLFLDFLSCFVKQELLTDRSTDELMKLDVSSECNRLHKKKIYLGAGTELVISKVQNKVSVNEFLDKAVNAYVSCAQYMQKTLPLNSRLLKSFSGIDPTARGHHVTLNMLKQLPKFIPNVLSEDDVQKYALEVHQYQVDQEIKAPQVSDGNPERIDIWWSHIFNMPKYTTLSKMVKAVLSCFHGPQVEGAFSMMGNIIDEKSGNMSVETHSAIQVVKYKLLSSEKSAIGYFKKNDYLHDPVDPALCRNLKNSYKLYKEQTERKKESEELKKKKLNANLSVVASKKKFKEDTEETETRARHSHERKRKLELMVKKIKEKKYKTTQ